MKIESKSFRNESGMNIRLLSFCVAVFLAGAGTSAKLQAAPGTSPDTLDEVVVTAQKREERLQDVPIAVSAISGAELESKGLDNLEAYTALIPGITFSEIGAGQRNGVNLVIRGIANSRFFDPSQDTTAALTTGFYIDDVPIAPVDPKIFDVSRIEVLKGPQGTLFGQASMGGTVRFITNAPDATKMSARADVSYGSSGAGSNLIDTDAMLNVPLIPDQLAARIVVSTRDDDGWINFERLSLSNPSVIAGTTPNVNTESAQSARITLRYTPTADLSITPMFLWQDRKTDMEDAYDRNLDQGYVRMGFVPEPREEKFTVGSLTGSYDTHIATITSVTGYTQRHFNSFQDVTYFTASNFGTNADGAIPAANLLALNYTSDIFSQEVRASLDKGAVSWLDATLGSSYFHESTHNHLNWDGDNWNAAAGPDNQIPGGIVEDAFDQTDYRNLSFFADATFHITDALAASIGARHFDQKATYNTQIRGVFSPNGDILTVNPATDLHESGVTPRFNLSYEVAKDHLVYTSAAKGFRLGGAGAPQTNPDCIAALATAGLSQFSSGTYKSDSIWSYEVGSKNEWFDNRMAFNVAAFYINWTDLQSTVELNRFNPGCPSAVTANLGKATSRGVEAELRSRFGPVELGASFDYTDARLGQPPPGVTTFADGDRLGGVPETSGSLTGQYNFAPHPWDMAWYAQMDITYRSNMLAPDETSQVDPFQIMPAYVKTNLRVGADGEHFGYALYVENAFNQVGDLGGGPLFGHDATDRVLTIRPRTVGIKVSAKF